jgi:hypothetical protein
MSAYANGSSLTPTQEAQLVSAPRSRAATAALVMADRRPARKNFDVDSSVVCVEAAHIVEVFSSSTIAVNAPQSQLRF